MPRPARFDTDTFLDAATRLAAESGPPAVTMAAVARRAGAPSGSIYHRFPDRPALTAALWLRTVEQFHAGFLNALGTDPADEAAVRAATHVAEWSRTHLQEAAILLAGADAFGQQTWHDADRRRLTALNSAVESALRRLVHRLGWRTGDQAERLVLAVVDLPYAIIRRHLAAGQPIKPRTVRSVTRAARNLINAENVGCRPCSRALVDRQPSPAALNKSSLRSAHGPAKSLVGLSQRDAGARHRRCIDRLQVESRSNPVAQRHSCAPTDLVDSAKQHFPRSLRDVASDLDGRR